MQEIVAAWDLGKGESQVLSLALKNSDCAAIVDDRAARRCGQALGITTIRTGGLLILAKRRGRNNPKHISWNSSFA
ncbi:hypothetical protein [Nostoc sp. DedQUE09]|uniref:hypothetical protein n=1 Tax=Nostoc sp. DedQUE09 TaxID=3075394 RepID=UPI002AD3523B|nr:hypothetical protein [Nostoc sp. DedQUE09]MDZ7954701.1 hypothetical protein [Nostoc sp. DedQUE09]